MLYIFLYLLKNISVAVTEKFEFIDVEPTFGCQHLVEVGCTASETSATSSESLLKLKKQLRLFLQTNGNQPLLGINSHVGLHAVGFIVLCSNQAEKLYTHFSI
jgi:hypothetical protein